MPERITREDVERIAETVSEGLEGFRVYAQARNGYIGLDLYREPGADSESAMLDTLHIGTKREVYTYLQGMRRAQLLRRRGE